MSLSLENQHPVIICTYTDMTDKPRLGWIKWRVVREQPFFSYPYANYCQTILSLTYALSEKNQYNHIPLEEAYSIIDLAKAAGYDTYWISNQAGFSASDTPITIISSTAAHHTWINGRGASPSDSTYLDGKLITELPDNVDRPSSLSSI
mgnify:CR=1 FL=1